MGWNFENLSFLKLYVITGFIPVIQSKTVRR